MAAIYYTCNLVPASLVHGAGHSLLWLGNHLGDAAAPARREALGIHPMTCPYVTRLVAAADDLLAAGPSEDGVIVPAGCDAMRRMGDLLAATYPDRVFVLPMPRSSGKETVRRLADDLARLDAWLHKRPPSPGTGEAPAEIGDEARARPPAVQYPQAPQQGGLFVVAGPLSDDTLLRLLLDLGAALSGLESCTSPDRWEPLFADELTPSATADGYEPASPYERIAAAMLAAGVCPRRSTSLRRAHLERRLDQTRPCAIVYARQSFCDPGAYDALEVARLAQERGLPYLEVEVGFPFEASGPLRTRVEAFLEAHSIDDDLLDAFDELDELDGFDELDELDGLDEYQGFGGTDDLAGLDERAGLQEKES
jgi:hypothetical protein